MKQALGFLFVFLFSISITFAQETASPQFPIDKPLSGILKFFNLDIPIFIDTFTNNQVALGRDVEAKAVEEQMEHIDLLEKASNNQVDDITLVRENEYLFKSENSDIEKLQAVDSANPAAVDDNVMSTIENTQSAIETNEESAGAQINGGQIENEVPDSFGAEVSEKSISNIATETEGSASGESSGVSESGSSVGSEGGSSGSESGGASSGEGGGGSGE